ncbi:MAG: ParB/RepB/Spo0J family partition protein [Pseudomonadota bacterium]
MGKKGLGRGLEAILGDMPPPEIEPRGSAAELPVSEIIPDKEQPRKAFSDDELEALAQSIRTRGVLQPILVRPKDAKGSYTIIAGERRWRAAQRAGLHKMPALVKEVEPGVSAEIALIENVQRVDLNPIEEADAYERLREQHGRKPGEIAEAVGKSRSHVANMLRLTQLPDEVRGMVVAGELSMGHARALLGAEDPLAVARSVVKGELSVRDTEKLISARKKITATPEKVAKAVSSASKDADTRALEQDLREALGRDVGITRVGKTGAGEVTLRYQDLDQLDDICRRLMGSAV